jgi:amino acid adenylation domain-containing protein
MNKDQLAFPLDDMQSAYFVGSRDELPLSVTAQYYREVEFRRTDLDVVQAAWNALIQRHEMLRAVLSDDGTQHILEHVPEYRIAYRDLDGRSEEQVQGEYLSVQESLAGENIPQGVYPQYSLFLVNNKETSRLHIKINLWLIDAISMQVLLAELLKLCEPGAGPLPRLDSTYRDYIETSRQMKASGALERSQRYWQKRVPSLPIGPELPLKCSPDSIKTPRFTHKDAVVQSEVWSRFSSLAKGYRITASTAVLAAYAATLAKWSRRQRFTLVVLLSKRPFVDDDYQGVVGNFGTTLLLEIDASVKRSFSEFAASIQKQLWSDIKHVGISGIEVGRQMNLHNETPLALVSPVTFTSLMSGWEDATDYGEFLEKFTHIKSRLDVPQVFLDHQVVEEPQGHLTVNWDFVDELFHEDVIDEMFDSYIRLLNRLGESEIHWTVDPFQLELPPVQAKVINEYNQTSVEFPDWCLDDFVQQQIVALKDSDKVAVINGDVQLTYKELGEQSDQLADELRAGGIKAGSFIAVLLPKGWQQVVAVLGIMKAGCAYVPMDPDLPAARRERIINKAGILAIVTSINVSSDGLTEQGTSIICIEELSNRQGPIEEPIEGSIKEPIEGPIKEKTIDGLLDRPIEGLLDENRAPFREMRYGNTSDIAYVIFTSGSTGEPKGVVIDHQGAMNTIHDINRIMDVGPQDKVLAISSLSFDLSVYDIFGILGAGGTMVIPTGTEQQDPDSWCRLVEAHKISLWNSVPALFQIAVDIASLGNYDFGGLKNVMLSGDWIPRGLPEKARGVATSANIYSLGGATEASIWSIIYKIEELDESWQSIPYGRPMANQTMHVLDDSLEPCPLWNAGEIYIGGKGVALGYLNDQERSDRQFIIHPDNGDRLYRTGDIGRMRPDGLMEFLGREDHQIKIRGFRIELGEIESTLVTIPYVSSAVVKVFGENNADKKLAAFVVVESDGTGSSSGSGDEIEANLRNMLPGYMIPDAIHLILEIPLTQNGKVNHHALASIHQEAQKEPPQQQLEGQPEESGLTELRLLWEGVLGRQNISVDASLFNLGGTSFQALQLIARIRETYDVKISLSTFTAGTTIREMATQLSKMAETKEESQPVLLLNNVKSPGDLAILCVHPIGGNVHCYSPLIECLPAEIPVYGVQSTAVESESEHSTIESLADQYVEHILRVVPGNRLMILGWSMGAAVAAEISKRLEAEWREIGMLGLIDPYHAKSVENGCPGRMETLYSFACDLAGISNRHFNLSSPRWQELAGLDDENMFAGMMQDLSIQNILPPNPPLEELKQVFHVFNRNARALSLYQPGLLQGNVVTFYASDDRRVSDQNLIRWQVSPEPTYHYELPGDHFSIMQTPAIRIVADAIMSCVGDPSTSDSTTGGYSPLHLA